MSNGFYNKCLNPFVLGLRELMRRAEQYLLIPFIVKGVQSKFLIIKYYLRRLLNYIGIGVKFPPETEITVDKMKICFSEMDLEFAPFREIYMDNVHENYAGFAINDLKGSEIIFDIGANIGLYTIKMASRLNSGRVYVFEPNPLVFKRLMYNLNENCPGKFDAFPYALGKRCEMTKMLIDGPSPTNSIVGRECKGKTIDVEMVTIDSLVERLKIPVIDILKLDVEGLECDVLYGASKSLPSIKKIVMEYHSKEVLNEIREFLNNNSFTMVKDFRGDAFFVNKE